MADQARKLAGFNELSLGISAGKGPNLLPNDQAAQAVNVTFRNDFPGTRPAWLNQPLQVIPSTWTGIFQGSLHYDGEPGASGWLVARGGRFFFISDQVFTVKDVTPQLMIVTLADFVLPGIGNQVTVPINGNPLPSVAGSVVSIGGIHYNVISVTKSAGVWSAILSQVDAGSGTVVAGTAIYDAGGLVQVTQTQVYSPGLNFVYMFMAENYIIVLGGNERTMIWDGSTLRPAANNEVPSGFLGAYGWGRIWVVHPDRRTFSAGDLVFGPSGTPQNGYRDAILKFTENDFLNEGGSFGVPYNAGPITAMQFLATQDTSLGIGVLLVGTTNMVFSVNAPVDRTTWKNLQYPIQTVSLIDYGPLSPRGTVSINGDMWYRSEDGIRSFIVARRNFPYPGNTPMSREVGPVLDDDTSQLLFYGSGMLFDNKLFMTVSPVMDLSTQVSHRGLVVINFDLVTDLRDKQPPAWEGVYTGLAILEVSKCRINDNERGFIWAQGPTDVELWEVTTDGLHDEFTVAGPDYLRGSAVSGINRKLIECRLQTRAEDYGTPLELKRLIMAEMYIEDIADEVTFTVSYKPDQYPNWIPWQTFKVCSTVSKCSPNQQ